MTKRVFTLILTALYLVISVGITVSGHFCGGHLTKYSLTIQSKHLECCCKGAPMKPGCCENKSVSLKTDVKHCATQGIQIDRTVIYIAKPASAPELISLCTTDAVLISVAHPPPDLPDCPLHIRNRTLLI